MKRRNRVIAVIVFTVLGAVALFLWRMTYVAPTWYAPPDSHDPQIEVLADKVENRMLEEAQKIREETAPWTVKVREPQVNAWLSARLPQWIEHEQNGHWPDQLGTPQVKIDAEGISMAIPLRTKSGSRPRYIVARVWPQMINGRLKLEIDRLALGRVILPGEPLANLLRTLEGAAPSVANDQKVRKALDIFTGERSVDPVTHLADHRRLRLVDFKLGDGWIDLTAQTIESAELSAAPNESAQSAH